MDTGVKGKRHAVFSQRFRRVAVPAQGAMPYAFAVAAIPGASAVAAAMSA